MRGETTQFSFGGGLRLRPETRRNMGIWVGVLTVMVVAAALFCEMHLTAAPIEQTAMTATVLLSACFVMYTSLFDAGRQKGFSAEAYRTLLGRYEGVRDRAREGAAKTLEAFCMAYVAEELKRSRRRTLLAAGETEEALEQYMAGREEKSAFRARPRACRRALRRAACMKPLRLHAPMLLSARAGERRTLILTTVPARTTRLIKALLPTIVGSFVTVAVTLEGYALTLPTVIAGLLRILTLILTGARGYAAGENSVLAEESTVLETKATLLELYLAEAGL